MLGRALNLDGTQRATSFSDVGASAKASGYIQSAVKKGNYSGYKDGTFKPDLPFTELKWLIIGKGI